MMTTKLAGTGLGISYKIAQALNSLIHFTSSVGTGSRFWFRLDVDKNAQENDRNNYLLHKTFHIQKLDFKEKNLAKVSMHGTQSKDLKLRRRQSVPIIIASKNYMTLSINENNLEKFEFNGSLAFNSFKVKNINEDVSLKKYSTHNEEKDEVYIKLNVERRPINHFSDDLVVASESSIPFSNLPIFVEHAGKSDAIKFTNHSLSNDNLFECKLKHSKTLIRNYIPKEEVKVKVQNKVIGDQKQTDNFFQQRINTMYCSSFKMDHHKEA